MRGGEERRREISPPGEDQGYLDPALVVLPLRLCPQPLSSVLPLIFPTPRLFSCSVPSCPRWTVCSPNSCLPRTSECDLVWKWGLCRSIQVKVSSYWVQVGPNPVTSVLLKKTHTERDHRGRMPCEDGGRLGVTCL